MGLTQSSPSFGDKAAIGNHRLTTVVWIDRRLDARFRSTSRRRRWRSSQGVVLVMADQPQIGLLGLSILIHFSQAVAEKIVSRIGKAVRGELSNQFLIE